MSDTRDDYPDIFRLSPKLRASFDAMDFNSDGIVKGKDFLDKLNSAGIELNDPRLEQSMRELYNRGGQDAQLTEDDFRDVVKHNSLIINKALTDRLVIPDFESFTQNLNRIMEETRFNTSGGVATYIPQLAKIDPDKYGFAVCTIDGQQYGDGDCDEGFCVQSCSNPVTYSIAIEDNSLEEVHRHIGREPSGHRFNALTLNAINRPHNPMVNSGAIMSCSLIKPHFSTAARFEYMTKIWSRLSGRSKVGFNNSVYLSERSTADRNFCLGYMMKEAECFPPDTDLMRTLEFYFQCCALEMSCHSMAVLASTLANGGVCPVSGERVLENSTVRACLSMMYSCGLYDYSGEWAFTVGIPAKSGVSGCVMVVVPNILGICIWSPRLDDFGNSVRGVEFCKSLVRLFNFHNYDNLIGVLDEENSKQDPRKKTASERKEIITSLLFASAEGDLHEVQRIVACGVKINMGNYDGRTALHLAATEGHLEVVEFLVWQGCKIDPKDRWGNTPLHEAQQACHDDVVQFLTAQNANN
eukprot:gb/GECH01002460.1/.p1 GENE.gb/GECH01002460.1/~~gb/GECH01002460.1/.p1  ORF type:complete len:526 (+),score=112.94 gb/GECH01002460.1/:1-1578(+)